MMMILVWMLANQEKNEIDLGIQNLALQTGRTEGICLIFQNLSCIKPFKM